MTRTIIHLDLDAFYCAVEELHNPSLRGKPFAVGGKPNERGVVSSCSYAARTFGVRSAMPMARAVQICRQLEIVSPHFSTYSKYSKLVMNVLRSITPIFEQISVDEAYLDISDFDISPQITAKKIQITIAEDINLPSSLGISTNKLVAKIANDYGKSKNKGPFPPKAITYVEPGQEAEFLHELPVISLLGVGPKTQSKLNSLGIQTIGHLAAWPEGELVRLFGKNGYDLYNHSRGIDNRPVATDHETKSISQETTFSQDINDLGKLKETLDSLSFGISKRLQSQGLSGKTIKLKLRWENFTTFNRQITLNQPTDQSDVIYSTVLDIFKKNWSEGQKVRLIGIGVSGFDFDKVNQLSLWDIPSERVQRLNEAISNIRKRFGEDVIKIGRKMLD